MHETKIAAMLGKGGVGKTAISAMLGRLLIGRGLRVLFIDADPAMGLACALNISGYKTIGEARLEIIEQARISSSEEEQARLADIVDYLLLEALYETPDYGLLVMGQSDRLGCYCPLNSLLRSTIRAIGAQYDWIIIDAEAGIEQVNRQVVESVHYPVIITDNSLRGVKTALMIHELIEKIPQMRPEKCGVIFNRVEAAAPELQQKLGRLECYGAVGVDLAISQADLTGSSILAATGPALADLEGVLQKPLNI